MEFVLLCMLIGLLPAAIASNKGKSFMGWWLYGALLFIVALPHALIMKSDKKGMEQKQQAEGLRKCPWCAEFIKPEAKVCRYCNRDITTTTADGAVQKPCRQCSTMTTYEGKAWACPNCKALND